MTDPLPLFLAQESGKGFEVIPIMRQADAITGYSVRLDAWFRREGRDWLAWCPGIDVMTQARTKKKAFESLTEAVQLWFESCIERGGP